ncbi:hypothetical protein SALBM217S_09330 [Streptomyces griseoloalbus]
MSPKATTSSCEMPRSAQHSARVLALDTPGPLISSRALGLERVTVARSPMASRARVRKASGSSSGWYARIFSTGSAAVGESGASSSSAGARSSGTSMCSFGYSGSWWKP